MIDPKNMYRGRYSDSCHDCAVARDMHQFADYFDGYVEVVYEWSEYHLRFEYFGRVSEHLGVAEVKRRVLEYKEYLDPDTYVITDENGVTAEVVIE